MHQDSSTRYEILYVHDELLHLARCLTNGVCTTLHFVDSLVGGKKTRPKNWDKLLDRLDETEKLVYTR